MEVPESWGPSRYDDLLRKYNIPKSRLFFIVDEEDFDKVRKTLKKSSRGLKEIRERHRFIVESSRYGK